MSRCPDLPAAGAPLDADAPARRWRLQGLSSAGLALVLLLAMLGAGQRPDASPSEPPAPPPQAEQVAAPVPAAAPVRGAVAPRAAAGPARPAAPAAARARRRVAAPPPAPAAPAAVARPAHAAMERTYVPDAHARGLCPAGTQSTDLGLTCRGAQVQHAGSDGYLVRFQVCPTTTGRLELRFAGAAEVAMSVVDAAGRAVWTWRPAEPFAEDPHVLSTDVGACWVWDTPWRQVDDDGRALRNGRYTLAVDFLEVEDNDRYAHPFEARS